MENLRAWISIFLVIIIFTALYPTWHNLYDTYHSGGLKPLVITEAITKGLEEWDWTPSDSLTLNILNVILHIIAWPCGYVGGIILDLLFYMGPLLVGGITGLIIALVVNIVIFIMRDVFKSGVGYIPFDKTGEITGVIFLAVYYAFFAWCITYYVLLVFGKTIKGVFVFSERRRIRESWSQDGITIGEELVPMPGGRVLNPDFSDEETMKNQLNLYRSNPERQMSIFGSWIQKARTKVEIELLRELLEKMDLKSQYYDKALELIRKQDELLHIDDKLQLEQLRRDLERKKLEDELAQYEADKEREKELSEAQHLATVLGEQYKQAELRKKMKQLDQLEEKEDDILKAVNDVEKYVISKAKARIELKRKFREDDYTEEEIEEFLDEFEQELVERGISRGGRF